MRSPIPLLAGLALAAGLAFAPTATAAPEPNPKAADHTTTAARQAAEVALARAEAVFAGTAPAADGREATIVLNELRKSLDSLSAADQQRARAILARPAGSKRKCSTHVCVHWVTSGVNAPSLRDGNHNNVPDYIDKVVATMEHVHSTYVKAGYRAPLSDKGRGGDNRPDVYIQDIGDESLYGYCTSDQSKPSDGSEGWNVWAYCVLDDDYAKSQFPTNTPIENMHVTAAHEYFHAVQFAYDGFEDGWIMEATATWAEDELYDSVNDNRFYLDHGQLKKPTVPLDTFDGLVHYGNWIFFRSLTEKYTASQGGLPTLVRDVWRRLDGKLGATDDYSLLGLENVLAARGTSLREVYGRFAVNNRAPGRFYEEGGAYAAAPATSVSITELAPNPSAFSRQMDHLTSQTVRYNLGSLTGDWNLTLSFNLGTTAQGGAALVTSIGSNGSRQTDVVTLDANGDGTHAVLFTGGVTTAVEVTLLNVSNRFDCWENFNAPAYSCGGIPLDDNVTQSVDPVASPI